MSRPSLSVRVRRRRPAARASHSLHHPATPTVVPTPAPAPSAGQGGRRRAARLAVHTATVLLLVSVPAAAYADATGTGVLAAAPKDLAQVIGNLQDWVMGILAALATLFLILAGVYWVTAGGDPAQVDKAKQALKNALVGYGLAVLAPILLQVVQGIVGG